MKKKNKSEAKKKKMRIKSINWTDKAYVLDTTRNKLKKSCRIYDTIIAGEVGDISSLFNRNK